MSRIVSVWLSRWPIQRFLASQARNVAPQGRIDPDTPFVLTVEGTGGLRVATPNRAAERLGIMAGESLSDARSRTGISQIRPADPASDALALKRLALWATRYTPMVALFEEAYGADGLFLDVTGAAHLFGGEENLLADLMGRLAKAGLSSRLAIADTAGAAWAMSRFHAATRFIVPSGKEQEALSLLPVSALRVSSDVTLTLRRLGIKKIGAILNNPRSPLAARFEKKLLLRLDQALGKAPEPLSLISPPPSYHRTRHLMEPVFSAEAVVAITKRLANGLVDKLERDGVGVRAFRLTLYRLDGEARTLDIGLTLPTRSAEHLARLLALRLERVDALADAGFGIETVSFAVTKAERMTPRQEDIAPTKIAAGDERRAALTDRLRQRLGANSVRWIAPRESHIPEKAEKVSEEAISWLKPLNDRPPLLLSRAEQTEVIAAIPEGPPRRFRWRGTAHRVAHAQGPERIASEWWKNPAPTRDYYIVEDDQGRRFWLYREGLYGRETANPRWFVHGFFS